MVSDTPEPILDGLIHIYECDQQRITGIIEPTDGILRANIPVTIKDEDTQIVAGVTDSNGFFDLSFYLDAGTYDPFIQCGNNTSNAYESGVRSLECSLVLTSDKDILSAADNETATLTAVLKSTTENLFLSDREITFEIREPSSNTLIQTLSGTTNSNGEAIVFYEATGVGDIEIEAKIGNLVSDSYKIEDIYFYDSGAVDHTSRYSSHYNYWGHLTNPTITQENDYYKIVPSSSNPEQSWIGNRLPVSSSLDNYELSVDIKTNITGGNNGVGVGIVQGSQQGIGLTQSNSNTTKHLVLYNPYDGGGSIANQVAVSDFHIDDWHTYKLTKNGTTVKFEILYGDTVLWSYTKTGIASNLATQTIPCLTINGNPSNSHWGYYKNIKVREL